MTLARSALSDSLVIGVVAFAQSVALAKTFAIKNGYRVDANQVGGCLGPLACSSGGWVSGSFGWLVW